MDTLTPAHRSLIMSRIRSKDTGPEMLLRKGLWKAGIRYRLHPKEIPGTPDLWFAKQQIAVFVHGCFWHGHENCKLYRAPKTGSAKWIAKVESNQMRDERAQIRLMSSGATIVILWECALRNNPQQAIAFVREFLATEHAPATYFEIRAVRETVATQLQVGRWE